MFNEQGKVKQVSMINYPDDNYEELKMKAQKCERCHLRAKCRQVVMGEGNTRRKIMFIGEGPGGDEDRQGRPFVGRAGQLLNKIFSAVNIKRENIYISNIVKCRPPDNRVPTWDEMDACAPILAAEIKIIEPKVIVPLGSTALKYLVDDNLAITRARGQWYNKGKLYFLPTFHPAYLLRNSNMKKYAWRDFKLIKKAIKRIDALKSSEKDL